MCGAGDESSTSRSLRSVKEGMGEDVTVRRVEIDWFSVGGRDRYFWIGRWVG